MSMLGGGRQGALPLEPHKKNFLKKVFLDFSKTLVSGKLRFPQGVVADFAETEGFGYETFFGFQNLFFKKGFGRRRRVLPFSYSTRPTRDWVEICEK